MRLIDADLFLENVRKELNCEGRCCECEHDNLCEVYNTVLKQPTAFDVDKVVERLEDYLFEKYCVEGDTKIDEILKSGGIE